MTALILGRLGEARLRRLEGGERLGLGELLAISPKTISALCARCSEGWHHRGPFASVLSFSEMDPARKVATLADLEALPSGVKGEIIEGVLYTMTRPRGPHQRTGGIVNGSLSGPFDLGRGGPGGWWIVPEPGIELANTPEVSPDVAGWRRERLPVLPSAAAITIVPDWVCEILSPTTRRHDLLVKKPYYAKVGVPYHWLIDLEARTVTSYGLESGRWLELGVYGDEHDARIEPFTEVALDIARWWI